MGTCPEKAMVALWRLVWHGRPAVRVSLPVTTVLRLRCGAPVSLSPDSHLCLQYRCHIPSLVTMKIFSLAVVLAPPHQSSTILIQASDLSSFSFYQRGSVGEFLTFFSKTIAERTPQGQRQSVQENNYTAHVYNRGGAEQLAGA